VERASEEAGIFKPLFGVMGVAAPNGPNGAITFKGRAIIHDDEETKAWFYPALAYGPYRRGGSDAEMKPEEKA